MLTIGIYLNNANIIENIRSNTTCKYELIVINNKFEQKPHEFIDINTIDCVGDGRLHHYNKIVEKSRYDNICIIGSNNIYLPYAWNEKLIRSLYICGISGPSTCNTNTKQSLKGIENTIFDCNEIERLSIKISNNFGLKILKTSSVSDICFCFNKKIIEKTGDFNELYKTGFYACIDLCYRAFKNKINVGLVKGCYVHNYKNFEKNIDDIKLMSKLHNLPRDQVTQFVN